MNNYNLVLALFDKGANPNSRDLVNIKIFSMNEVL